MLALLLSSLIACSSTSMDARNEAYKECAARFSGYNVKACQEGARYRFNRNGHERSDFYCGKLQPYNLEACYKGVDIFEKKHKEALPFSKVIGEVESSALAVNQESETSSDKSISGKSEMMSVEKSAVSI